MPLVVGSISAGGPIRDIVIINVFQHEFQLEIASSILYVKYDYSCPLVASYLLQQVT